MKPHIVLIQILAAAYACGQGTFIYDQQSADERLPGASPLGIQVYQPIGQSFTPALSSVGFVRFEISDNAPGNGLGATIYVNLRTNSITGPVLASTTPVVLPDGLGDSNTNAFINFFFPTPADVTPGVIYYFQPVVQSGDVFVIYGSQQSYPGGAAYFSGQIANGDLWFREGIFIVPEPSSALLMIVGGVTFIYGRRRREKA